MDMKAIWKFGPFFGGERFKVMGRPVSVGIQNADFYVWCEVDPTWKDLPNTKESDARIDWHTLYFVGTGMSYVGKYIGTIHTQASDGVPYVFHCIEVDNDSE